LNTVLEHDQEAAPGIPEPLPGGETIRWQGAPEFRSLALRSFGVRALAVYFCLLLLLQLGLALSGGATLRSALGTTVGSMVLAVVALGLISAYAKLVARSSLFTITDRRVVIRTGVALPVTINLPYALIDSADLRLHGDGSGDICIKPRAGNRASWLLLWPMVKFWRWFRVQPVLRGIANAESVASILAAALAEALEGEASSAAERKPRASAGKRTRETNRPRSWRPYPTIPLAAMVTLVVISLVVVGWNVARVDALVEPAAFAAKVDLFFEDQDDGSVLVRDAFDGRVVDRLDPGTNGFLRATLRSLVNARGAVGAGSETPFTVGRTESGRVVLHDPVSNRNIDLRAFGQQNAQAFVRFLTDDRTDGYSSAMDHSPVLESDTAVALRHQESQ
jgi:putative photosynthetic complex assembly protein